MKYSYKNNSEFIEQLKKGDENAFTYLVKTYHKKLFVYVLCLTNDETVSEDIVQNVFLNTWEYRKRLNPDYSLKSFLYKSTYNEFVTQYNKLRSTSKLELAYIEALNEVVDDNNNEILERKIVLVSKGINKLPNKCKITFLLSKEDGLTNIEIAEFLNISLKTVEGQLTKAYKLLREWVGDELKEILFLLFGVKKRI